MPYAKGNPKLAESRQAQDAKRREETLLRQAAKVAPVLTEKLKASKQREALLRECQVRDKAEFNHILGTMTEHLNKTVCALKKAST